MTSAAGVAAHCVGLTKRYGSGPTAVVALDSVDVALAQGQFTAIMGPSGSGKSTLMHCMAGLDGVTSGSVYIGEVELNALDDRRLTRLRRDRIGFVFQAYNLVPTLTALENITLPADIAGHPIDQAWLSAVIDTLGLRDRLGHRPAELSGGQQQRVACARALASRPTIVFADEPTGNLDSRTSAEVLSFLRESVRRTGQTIAMVTHDPSAAAYADRVLFLADGRIVDEMYDPTAERVLERMKAFEADVPHPEVVWADYTPAEAAAAPVNGSEAPTDDGPDALDMANWTDADWDAWLARKSGTGD
jgi:putative ABC transport system ATP-binding protein